MTENNFDKKDFIRKEVVYAIAVAAFIIGCFSSLLLIKITTPSHETDQKQETHEHGKTEQNIMPGKEVMNKLVELEKKAMDNPKNADLWIELGNTYFDLARYPRSITAYENSLKLKPNNPNILTDLGVMYRRNKQPLKAIESFEKAMKADLKHKISRMNKGIVLLYDLNDKKGAIQAWEDLLRIDPNMKNSQGESIKSVVDRLKKEIQ